MSFRVYWQPGCTSCLRTKEFLSQHGVAYESVNVRATPGAMEELAAFGLRSVPAVSDGERAIYAQEIREVADFVGIPFDQSALPPGELINRLDLILSAADRYLGQLPESRIDDRLPGRNRSWRDLGYHLFVIVQGFLDAARGGELTEEHFLRKPPPEVASFADCAAFGAGVRAELGDWWRSVGQRLPAEVSTYYGQQAAHTVLERSCWHVAQHVRQLMALLEIAGIAPDQPLGPAELAGLPLPEKVWDSEVPLDSPG
jgi:glutaredoxin